MEKEENLKVLFVEDDEIARENGIEFLENYFDHIFEAADAISASKLYEEHKPDIIVTDIQMPKLNGLEFISNIRAKDKKVQVIVLSAFSDKEYLFKAIELGLVKYLVKPVNDKEFEEALELCVDSIKNDSSNIIEFSKDISFDTYNKTLKKDNELIKLRTKELSLLELLIKNKNRYVTYSEIENIIWYDGVMTKDALKTLIKNLKSKLPVDSIANLSGTGYKIELH